MAQLLRLNPGEEQMLETPKRCFFPPGDGVQEPWLQYLGDKIKAQNEPEGSPSRFHPEHPMRHAHLLNTTSSRPFTHHCFQSGLSKTRIHQITHKVSIARKFWKERLLCRQKVPLFPNASTTKNLLFLQNHLKKMILLNFILRSIED